MPEPEAVKRLIVVAGPTAVGKTNLTIRLAQHFNCPILSADARQCYRELGIATAKPSEKELARVKHYFVNSHSIFDPVSAAQYEQYALGVLERVFETNTHCLLAGGSGLYIRAVCEGLDEIPRTPHPIKQQLEQQWQEQGLQLLLEELRELDEDYYHKVDKSNPRRVIRALEVIRSTGKPFSVFRQGAPVVRPFKVIKIALDRDRTELYQRIDQRMDKMIDQGLFKEARQLLEFKELVPLQTVGYQEVFGYLQGEYPKGEAVRLLKRNSRRYAKRQLTWFRKDQEFQWFHPDQYQEMLQYIESN